MKKLVLKLDLQGEKDKKKAMATVSGISGVNSVEIDLKEKKMTVTGEVDAVKVASKLMKLCHTEIVTLGEVKEDKKNDEKKEVKGGSSGDDRRTTFDIAELERPYRLYNPCIFYPIISVEENPNSCVIC